MLKKYVRPDSLQFVGKAWEIRHALRQEKKLRGADTPLCELLSPPRSDRYESK
ncbi:Z-ring formation inhibitor MciZ [Cohnella kolymensis]|uniref:Z-ring formation inhibitor MciZ n=1 Tax=Cohnella kolymensis TaxID=1590652 RepID=UPI0009E1D1DD|nr:Z-ring formation inhibitor MciZ [Cohnella kolymensis]